MAAMLARGTRPSTSHAAPRRAAGDPERPGRRRPCCCRDRSRARSAASGSTTSTAGSSRRRRPTRASPTASSTRRAWRVTGQWARRQGVSIRTPAPLPPLASARARPRRTSLLVITESVRADATCSDPPPACQRAVPRRRGARPRRRSASSRRRRPTRSARRSCSGRACRPTPTSRRCTPRRCCGSWRARWATARRTCRRRTPTTRTSASSRGARASTCWSRAASWEACSRSSWARPTSGPWTRRCASSAGCRRGTPYFAVLHLSNTHMPYRIDPGAHAVRAAVGRSARRRQRVPQPLPGQRALQERSLSALLASLAALPALGRHGRALRVGPRRAVPRARGPVPQPLALRRRGPGARVDLRGPARARRRGAVGARRPTRATARTRRTCTRRSSICSASRASATGCPWPRW